MNMYVYMYVCMYICACVRVRMCMCTCVCMYVCIYVFMYVCMYVCTYEYPVDKILLRGGRGVNGQFFRAGLNTCMLWFKILILDRRAIHYT